MTENIMKNYCWFIQWNPFDVKVSQWTVSTKTIQFSYVCVNGYDAWVSNSSYSQSVSSTVAPFVCSLMCTKRNDQQINLDTISICSPVRYSNSCMISHHSSCVGNVSREPTYCLPSWVFLILKIKYSFYKCQDIRLETFLLIELFYSKSGASHIKIYSQRKWFLFLLLNEN